MINGGFALQMCAKIRMFCSGISLKIEDGEGGSLVCRVILYGSTYIM